jgi:hypothetical protein
VGGGAQTGRRREKERKEKTDKFDEEINITKILINKIKMQSRKNIILVAQITEKGLIILIDEKALHINLGEKRPTSK